MKSNQKVIANIVLALAIIAIISIAVYSTWSKKSKNINYTEPLATQTDTPDWKTYTDTKNGFEFKYPSTFEVFKDNDGNIHIIHPEDKKLDAENQGPLDGIWIYFVDNKNKLSLMDWWNKEGPFTTPGSHGIGVNPDTFPIEKMTVSGVDGIYVAGTEGFLSNMLFLPYKDKIIEMILMTNDSVKILSTFKFTK